MAPEVLEAPAPAKVNLVLEVTGQRLDGYHEIDTVLQTLELADTVQVLLGGAPGMRITGPCAAGTPDDESNLAWRAAIELAARCGKSLNGLGIHIDKWIPAAGGLGGGASDAATVLRLLAQRWGAAEETVLECANAIGSDEAFFLVGGTARATGRGERVERLHQLTSQPVVLFVPETTIERKTARMFGAIDRMPFDDGSVSRAFTHRFRGRVRSEDVFNAFERVAFDLFDGLAATWEKLEERIGEPVHLAGAGPTLFWIGTSTDMATRALNAASGLQCTPILTRTAAPA